MSFVLTPAARSIICTADLQGRHRQRQPGEVLGRPQAAVVLVHGDR